MGGQAIALEIDDGDEVILRSGSVHQPGDACPYLAFGGVRGSRRLSADTQHRSNRVPYRRSVAAHEDHCRSPMAGYIGATRIEDVRKVYLLRQELLDERLPKLT